MTVCVVVPCRNEAAHISTLLDALAGQTRAPAEIIIVNDCSTDSTADVVRAWQAAHQSSALRLIDGPGQGPAAAVNAGIRATNADVIMRMDGHSIPARDYLELSLEALRADGAGVVGGIWIVSPGAESAVARAIAAVVSHPLGSGGAGYRSVDDQGPVRRSVETVPFGTFPRAVWEQLGGFDESLAVNEDFDFNYRARKAGHDVVLDRRIRATYVARPTISALGRQYRRYGYWKFQMLRKDPRAFHLRQLLPALIAPWVVLTAVALVVTSASTVRVVAGVYPLAMLLGGLHAGLTRSVNPLLAAWAFFTVHLSWSAGFWTAALSRAPSRPLGQSRR